NFPVDADEESIMAVKRPGGLLERGGLSLLRRSARTKIRRNSTASNDIRPDPSRLRQTLDSNGEYPPVSLVDPGPQPLPSLYSEPISATSVDINSARKDEEPPQPSKRFVSTLRDSSKPTITTYVEPHLLEQQRKENEANSEDSSPSFRISAPAKLENSAAARLLVETIENDHKERLESFSVSYPIPPPVKLAQNLLQQPSSQQTLSSKASVSASQSTQSSSKQKSSGQTGANGTTLTKKPSTWSWLWGKEKGEKTTDSLSTGSNISPPSTRLNGQPPARVNNEINTQMPSTQTPPASEVTIKKQSTLSMLFSRNGKSSSSKGNATTAETTHSVTTNSGQVTSSDRPKYSNYNRLPIHIERAIYRLSHVKLANPRRPLQEQVLISNMMFWYLGVIQQQQMLQQQAEQLLQQQQQKLIHSQKDSKASDSKEEGKDKSKQKPKKRKSQKKKTQQRGSSKSAEIIVKNPEYEKQHQYHNNAGVNHVARPIQQGSGHTLVSAISENQRRTRGNTEHDEESRIGGGSQDFSESEGEDGDSGYLTKQQFGSQSDTLSSLSIRSPPRDAQGDEEDDDVPLAHYQNMPRQSSVPVS
ncbi:hypothetical protein BGZ46_004976, partial [Entomortierella lignicola]